MQRDYGHDRRVSSAAYFKQSGFDSLSDLGNSSSLMLCKSDPGGGPAAVVGDGRQIGSQQMPEPEEDLSGWSSSILCPELEYLNVDLDFEQDFLSENFILEDSWVPDLTTKAGDSSNGPPRAHSLNGNCDNLPQSRAMPGTCSAALPAASEVEIQRRRHSSLSDGGWTEFLTKECPLPAVPGFCRDFSDIVLEPNDVIRGLGEIHQPDTARSDRSSCLSSNTSCSMQPEQILFDASIVQNHQQQQELKTADDKRRKRKQPSISRPSRPRAPKLKAIKRSSSFTSADTASQLQRSGARSDLLGDIPVATAHLDFERKTKKVQPGTSQFRGVSRHRLTKRWEASLWVNRKQLYLGGYNDEASAARAYDMAALFCKGDQCLTNFPPEDYAEEMKAIDGFSRDTLVAHLRRNSCAFSRGKSRYRGVSGHHGRWEARIGQFNGRKNVSFGVHDSQEDAARQYDRALIIEKGELAKTNFPVQDYVEEIKVYVEYLIQMFGTSNISASAEARSTAKRYTLPFTGVLLDLTASDEDYDGFSTGNSRPSLTSRSTVIRAEQLRQAIEKLPSIQW